MIESADQRHARILLWHELDGEENATRLENWYWRMESMEHGEPRESFKLMLAGDHYGTAHKRRSDRLREALTGIGFVFYLVLAFWLCFWTPMWGW